MMEEDELQDKWLCTEILYVKFNNYFKMSLKSLISYLLCDAGRKDKKARHAKLRNYNMTLSMITDIRSKKR